MFRKYQLFAFIALFISQSILIGQSEFQIEGKLTMPWGAKIYHRSEGFATAYQHLLWLNKDWNSELWDYTYLGGSGNRDSEVQPALLMSHKLGIMFGKGTNDASGLSAEHLRISASGDMGIGTSVPSEKLDVNGDVRVRRLAGTGDRNVVVDANGVLQAGSSNLKYLSLSGAAFHPTHDNNAISWTASSSGAYFSTAPSDYKSITANVSLPHGSTVHAITVYCTDSDATNNVRFFLGFYDNVSRGTGSLINLESTATGFQTLTTATTTTIDNIRRSYVFSMQPTSGSGAGYMNSNFRIHHVVMEYSE